MCEFCSPDEPECGVCRPYRDPERKRFSAAVAAGCLAGLIVFVATAVVCGIINYLGGAK